MDGRCVVLLGLSGEWHWLLSFLVVVVLLSGFVVVFGLGEIHHRTQLVNLILLDCRIVTIIRGYRLSLQNVVVDVELVVAERGKDDIRLTLSNVQRAFDVLCAFWLLILLLIVQVDQAVFDSLANSLKDILVRAKLRPAS